jgi:hypothetical protein
VRRVFSKISFLLHRQHRSSSCWQQKPTMPRCVLDDCLFPHLCLREGHQCPECSGLVHVLSGVEDPNCYDLHRNVTCFACVGLLQINNPPVPLEVVTAEQTWHCDGDWQKWAWWHLYCQQYSPESGVATSTCSTWSTGGRGQKGIQKCHSKCVETDIRALFPDDKFMGFREAKKEIPHSAFKWVIMLKKDNNNWYVKLVASLEHNIWGD